MATTLPSFPLLDTFPATWLEAEKERWLVENLIHPDDDEAITCQSGLLQDLVPGSLTAANSLRDESIVPDGGESPSLLVMARLRAEMETSTSGDIRGAFQACLGDLRKVICFVWDILPGGEVALDVEVYEYDVASGSEKLDQRVRILPASEQHLRTLELRVTYGDVFAAYPPTGRAAEDIIRIPLVDLKTSAEEVIKASELSPASISSSPPPAEQLVHSHVAHAEEHYSSVRVTKHEVVEETLASDFLNVHFNSTRKIGAMYPEDDPRIAEMARTSFTHSRTVAEEMSLRPSKQNLLRIAKLAPYDVVIYGDDSNSMNKHGRYDALCALVHRFIPAATRICNTGVSMRFINSPHDADLNNIRHNYEVNDVFERIRPHGATPIGTRLRQKITLPFIDQLRNGCDEPLRPKLVVVITDGKPFLEQDNNPDALRDAIVECKTTLNTLLNERNLEYGDASIAFMLSLIGDSKEARKFVDNIANDRRISDMVYCNRERIEAQMSVPAESERSLTLLSLLGAAIDKTEFSSLRGRWSR